MQGHLLLFRKPELLTATTAATATTATTTTSTTTEPTAPNKATKATKTTKTETNESGIVSRIPWLELALIPMNWLAYLKIVYIQHLKLILKLIHLYNLRIFIEGILITEKEIGSR
ncbi:hypothetical protein ACQKKK_09175 [Peribacillus sp. NPDC006672]|uniref:hypothetical protein n=1 Tax=Peribacillus sp. NPDC006672 TaxID=3390606 RepID=UPI003CFD6CC4